MPSRPPRVAARALLVRDGRLLLVNAFPPGSGSDLWCAPGGGVEGGDSLTETLVREVFEETGLTVKPGPLAAVSEFRNPANGFHQIDMLFHASLAPGAALPQGHVDPAGVVDRCRWVAPEDSAALSFKPDHLFHVAFGRPRPAYYGIERMLAP